MPLLVRPMTDEDARTFLEVHHAAVRETAAADYSRAVLEAWATLPVTPEAVASVRANPDHEIRFIAELDGEIVGIGALVVANAELRACYVRPDAGREGVGSALVQEIERTARDHGLRELHVSSSLTAERFYSSHGYVVVERGEHILRNGQPMACVKMRKSL